ncbi:hypothetical protein [Cytobacillus sp. NCCP-133]|uniref:hypothetical protein n=1 Tax=Cytobacillus sp. NCCP-133 TaxID=766848 RepID=UPI00222F5CE9|nr:hypothetical protein [Cytobacillus sp. NCCP-133]
MEGMNTAEFALILERAFYKGQLEKDITLSELMEELTKQLKNMIDNQTEAAPL